MRVEGRLLDDAVDEANRVIRERLNALEDDLSADGIRAVAGTGGDVLVYRTRVTVQGDTSEPRYAQASGRGDDPLTPIGRSIVEDEARRHARRTLRLRALARAGVEDEPPTWAYTMHRLLRGMLLNAGVDPAIAVHRSKDGSSRDGDFLLRYMAEQNGLMMGAAIHEDGRLDYVNVLSGGIEYSGRAGPRLIVTADLPDTVAASLGGRLVADVVDHPAVRRAGPVRIRSATVAANGVTLLLADTQEFVRRPPRGFDRGWARVPYHTHERS